MEIDEISYGKYAEVEEWKKNRIQDTTENEWSRGFYEEEK
jgi:hypothetical protein